MAAINHILSWVRLTAREGFRLRRGKWTPPLSDNPPFPGESGGGTVPMGAYSDARPALSGASPLTDPYAIGSNVQISALTFSGTTTAGEHPLTR